MIWLPTILLGTYCPGTYYSVLVVGLGIQNFNFRALRSSWPDPNNQVIEVDFYASYDGGETFTLLGGFGAGGGTIYDQNGNAVPYSSGSTSVAEPLNLNRQLKVVMTVYETLTTEVDYTILS